MTRELQGERTAAGRRPGRCRRPRIPGGGLLAPLSGDPGMELLLLDCAGRVLAEDVRAGLTTRPLTVRPWTATQCAADIDQVRSPAVLQVIGEVDAGAGPRMVGPPGHAHIMTGAPIPGRGLLGKTGTDGLRRAGSGASPVILENYCFKGEI